MEDKIFIKPAEGLLVKDPETEQPLPAEGDYKTRGPYWDRRLNDGDVIESKPADSAKVAPATSAGPKQAKEVTP